VRTRPCSCGVGDERERDHTEGEQAAPGVPTSKLFERVKHHP
jgi:hypothetical protein